MLQAAIVSSRRKTNGGTRIPSCEKLLSGLTTKGQCVIQVLMLVPLRLRTFRKKGGSGIFRCAIIASVSASWQTGIIFTVTLVIQLRFSNARLARMFGLKNISHPES